MTDPSVEVPLMLTCSTPNLYHSENLPHALHVFYIGYVTEKGHSVDEQREANEEGRQSVQQIS